MPPGHRLLHFASLDSTNAEAQRQWASGERGPLWIWAGAQTAGRGRLGRTWISEEGNVYATFLFSPHVTAAVASQTGFVASLAVRDAAASLTGDNGFALKWPNDVLLRGAKVSGILPESLGGGESIAIGMGLNLAHAPEGTPYPVAALGAHIAPRAALEALAEALQRWLDVWHAGLGFAAIGAAWFAHAIGKQDRVTADLGGHDLVGRFTGLGPDGALLLEDGHGMTHTIHAGEVRFAALQGTAA